MEIVVLPAFHAYGPFGVWRLVSNWCSTVEGSIDDIYLLFTLHVYLIGYTLIVHFYDKEEIRKKRGGLLG